MGLRIWGTGWWEYERTLEEGVFRCPREREQREYRIRRGRRWITVFFIPLIPLGTVGLWAECRKCKGLFGLETVSEESRLPDAPP